MPEQEKMLALDGFAAELAKIAGEAGAKAAMAEIERQKQGARGRIDRRLRNIKLLLLNYHMLMEHVKHSVYTLDQAMEVYSVTDILVEMDDPLFDNDDLYIESIKTSTERTMVMMAHVEAMLRILESDCKRSPRPEDRRRYQIMYDFYLAEPRKSAIQLAKEHHLDKRSVYKDIGIAVERLSALMFGICGLKIPQ